MAYSHFGNPKKCQPEIVHVATFKKYALPISDLKTIYNCYIKPVLVYATPVWNGGITREQAARLESIQKRALRVILGREYYSYEAALSRLQLPLLSDYRESICIDFAKKLSAPESRFGHLFPSRDPTVRTTRHSRKVPQMKYRTNRLRDSAIPYFIRLINDQ